jgi:hypothetical protein
VPPSAPEADRGAARACIPQRHEVVCSPCDDGLGASVCRCRWFWVGLVRLRVGLLHAAGHRQNSTGYVLGLGASCQVIAGAMSSGLANRPIGMRESARSALPGSPPAA